MRKRLLFLILAVVMTTFFVTGCAKKEAEESTTTILTATIMEINGENILVTPVEGSWELSSTDCISVSMENMSDSEEPEIGDTVEITYNGEIMESYPSQLGNVTNIKIVATEEVKKNTGEE